MTNATYIELSIDQGTDFSQSVTILNEITAANVDINGYVVESHIKKSFLSANVTDHFICTVTDASSGEILMSMPSANTANLKPGKYVFDVLVTNTLLANSKSRIMQGLVLVSPGITGITN